MNAVGKRIYWVMVIIIFTVGSCKDEKKEIVNNQPNLSKRIDSNNATEKKIDTIFGRDPFDSKEDQNKTGLLDDSMVVALSRQVLLAFKQGNPRYLLNFIHPTVGLRLSPYGYVDTVHDVVLGAKLFDDLNRDPSRKILWGNYDGSGDPIELNFADYSKKFIYDVDFLKAEKVALNSFIGHGNSLNNLQQVYPDADFVEYHFSGLDKKYEGMDWRSLRIVFKKIGNKYYLIGIVHDQWTI